jgi:membrane protease YdiL (CAAX protease family)
MEKLMRRISNSIIIALASVAVIAGLFVAFTGEEASMGLNVSMILTYIMVSIAIVLIILFAIIQVASNKKQLLTTVILFAVVAFLVLICYFISPSELSDVAKRVGVTENIYRWIGAALTFAYITMIGVIVALFGTLIYIKIKK